MTSATQFFKILNSSLSPLVDSGSTVIARFKSSAGFTSRPNSSHVTVNFINLPLERHEQRRGGGAESENNRMLFSIWGFDGDPAVAVDKVKIEQLVNSIRGSKSLRAKTASPDKVAAYLAKYINEIAKTVPPSLTHK